MVDGAKIDGRLQMKRLAQINGGFCPNGARGPRGARGQFEALVAKRLGGPCGFKSGELRPSFSTEGYVVGVFVSRTPNAADELEIRV